VAVRPAGHAHLSSLVTPVVYHMRSNSFIHSSNWAVRIYALDVFCAGPSSGSDCPPQAMAGKELCCACCLLWCCVLQDPYKNEPSRHPALLVRSSKPFNGETPPELLTAAPITPVDVFYVRHHLPVPDVPADNYSLKVCWAGALAQEHQAAATACANLSMR
jgi:hypothetical protein